MNTTQGEAMRGLEPLFGWLEALTGLHWQALPPDAEDGARVVANGQPLAALAAEGADEALLAGAASLVSWAADRLLTVQDLTRQSARLWQELGFFHRMGGRLDAVARPLDGLPVLLEAVARLLRSKAGWLLTRDPEAPAFALTERPVPDGLWAIAEAARSGGGALALSKPEHLPEGLSSAERAELAEGLPLLVAPLLAQGELVGVMAIAAPIDGQPYSSYASKLVFSGASMATGLLLRARMVREAESAASYRRELEVARRIQHTLRPRRALELPELTCWGWCREAALVGGDLYGWWASAQPGEPIWFYVGDVSGHGVGPALLMSNAYAVLRALCREGLPAPEVAERLNAVLCEDIEQSVEYLTLTLMRYEPTTRTLHYVGLGHPPVMLFRAGADEPEWLEGEGLPAGLFSGVDYPERTVQLAPGDLLVAYTDGIPESEFLDGEPFGLNGLARFIARHREAPLRAIGEALVNALEANSPGEMPADDQTLLLVRVG